MGSVVPVSTEDLPNTIFYHRNFHSAKCANLPFPPAPSDSGNGTSGGRDPRHELGRYTRLVRRVQWKLPSLAMGYQQALARDVVDPAQAAEAELMFKLDFFEVYMLIERALVHLLGVFDIEVENRSVAGPSHSLSSAPRFTHRYHANVLETLDRPENPLHAVLGTGEVRRQLTRAKDLRNRWKNAQEPEADARDGIGSNNRTRFVPAPLESYDIEKILTTIFDGFDQAYMLAERSVARNTGVDAGAITPSEEEQWDFMVDAMDWEAV